MRDQLQHGKGVVPETPGLDGERFARTPLQGQTPEEARRALKLEEILSRADTIANSDFGPVHVSENAKGVHLIVGRFKESTATAATPEVANFVILNGRLAAAQVNDAKIFTAADARAVDSLIDSVLHHIDKR